MNKSFPVLSIVIISTGIILFLIGIEGILYQPVQAEITLPDSVFAPMTYYQQKHIEVLQEQNRLLREQVRLLKEMERHLARMGK